VLHNRSITTRPLRQKHLEDLARWLIIFCKLQSMRATLLYRWVALSQASEYRNKRFYAQHNAEKGCGPQEKTQSDPWVKEIGHPGRLAFHGRLSTYANKVQHRIRC
jgi:hypothetical protein